MSFKESIISFEEHFGSVITQVGVFDGSKNTKELCREFFNRFYSNLVSINNHYNLKDVLSASLVQRYNHELMIDFWYLLSDGGESDKIDRFFNYDYRSYLAREWSAKNKSERRKYIPKELVKEGLLKEAYKSLSDAAHPNIYSIQLNRRGEVYKYHMIENAFVLMATEIMMCLEHKNLYKLFPEIEWEEIRKNNKIQLKKIGILIK